MCKKVRDLVYSDRRIQVEEIAQTLGILHGSVSTILHDRLGIRKLTARWGPKSISDEQMATRASVCSALLQCFRWKDDFLLRLVTIDDETWVHYYEPKNKAHSREWVGPGSPRPKKFKTQYLLERWWLQFFGDSKGVILLYFLSNRCTINRAYYANLLNKLRTAIREKQVLLVSVQIKRSKKHVFILISKLYKHFKWNSHKCLLSLKR